MHYLGLALYAEGPTDYYLLCPLLQRLCEDICMRSATTAVEVSDVICLDHPRALQGSRRDERVVAAAKGAAGAWKLLFIHSDGASDPTRARNERVNPAIARLLMEQKLVCEGVAVIPVRETEAWALADGDTLREVFGTSMSDSKLGLPNSPVAIEAAADPKKVLLDAFHAINPPRARRRKGTSPMLNLIGEQISLERLRRLPAFAQLEVDVRAALTRLGILS